MEDILMFISAFIAGVLALVVFNTRAGKGSGPGRVESDIQRAGGAADSIGRRHDDNSGIIDRAEKRTEEIESEQQRIAEAGRKLGGLIKRGRAALEKLKTKNPPG